jgi:hypothetical protein
LKPVLSKQKVDQPLDPVKTGALVRKHRRACSVSIRALTKPLNVSESYLYMLEQGYRGWSRELFDQVIAAINELAKR